MPPMNKCERVRAAIAGQDVDRLPLSFWKHDFTKEDTAEALARESLRLFDTFDWDFLKPQSRPFAFAEMWGLLFEHSKEKATRPVVTHFPVSTADDFAALKPVDPAQGALGEFIESFRIMRGHVGRDVPLVATIFSPIMVAKYLLPNGEADVLRFMAERPEALERGLAAIAETLAHYARLLTDEGIDGIFYATTAANADKMDAAQFERFQRRFDLPILAQAKGWFNILHMCGSNILFDSFLDYPVPVLNWEPGGKNPTLLEGYEKSGRTVIGGLPGKPVFGQLSPREIKQRMQEAARQLNRHHLILGPGCSVNANTPEDLILAASEEVKLI